MSKYGEPFVVIRDAAGTPMQIVHRSGDGVAVARCYDGLEEQEGWADRIVSCVNAMAGISDPAAFVQAAKEAMGILRIEVEDDVPISDEAGRILAAMEGAING